MADFDKCRWRRRSSPPSLSSSPPLSSSPSLSPLISFSSSPSLSHFDSSRPTGPIIRGGFSRLCLSFSSTLFLLLLLSISAAMVSPAASQAPGSQDGNGYGDCASSYLTGYVCAKSVSVNNDNNLSIVVHWAYPDGDELSMAVEANSEAWVGIGWGTTMVQSHSVIGVDNISAKFLPSTNQDTFIDIPTGFIDVPSSSITRANGITTMKFTRLMNFSESPVYLNNTLSPMIYAIGRSQTFGKHIHDGKFTVKLSEVLTAAPSQGASPSERPVLLSYAPGSSPPLTVADTSAAASVGPGWAKTSLAATNCSPSSFPGLTCSMDLQGGPSLHWNPPTANGGMEIAFQIEGRKAWAAVGWTEDGKMRGDAVIAGKDPNVGAYRIESYDVSTIMPSTRFNISNASWNVTDTSTILRFTRQEDDGSVPPNQSGVQLMWAHARPDVPGFDYHGIHHDAISQPWERTLVASVTSDNSIDVSSSTVSLPGGRTFQWSRVPMVGGGANAQEMVNMIYRVPGEVAWLSVGWNENGKMAGNAVIGMTGGDVTTYELIGKSADDVVPTRNFSIDNASISYLGDATVLRFSRSIDGVDLKASGSTGMIWAHARPGDAGFGYHGNNEGSMRIDLESGQATASGTNSNSYYYAHAWLMWIAFGILFPAAIFLARYGKRWDPMWFKAHVALQLLAVVISTAGFIIAVKKFDALDGLHGRLGIAVMLLVWIQPVIGLARPHKGTLQRVPWYFLHWLFGTSAAFLALLNIFYGIELLDAITGVPKVIEVLFSLEVAFTLAAYLLLNELPYILSQRQTTVPKLAEQNIAMTTSTER